MLLNTNSAYKYKPYDNKPTVGGVNWAEMKIEAGELTHEDIPMFSFASLDQIRKDLEETGYPQEEIDSTIVGLSELPEYENSK